MCWRAWARSLILSRPSCQIRQADMSKLLSWDRFIYIVPDGYNSTMTELRTIYVLDDDEWERLGDMIDMLFVMEPNKFVGDLCCWDCEPGSLEYRRYGTTYHFCSTKWEKYHMNSCGWSLLCDNCHKEHNIPPRIIFSFKWLVKPPVSD